MTRRRRPLTTLLLVALCAPPSWGAPAGSAFTYQGRLLESGTPPTGPYDLQFTLYDVPAGGAPLFPPVIVDDVAVAAGLFTVSLDFGASAFTGEARFMEIGVRPGASSGAFTLLSGRQELRPTPNALATPWTGVNGKPAGFADDVDNDVLGTLACAGGEVAKWNGSAWACAADADSGGDITAVTAGIGLTGGGSSGAVGLQANFAGSGAAASVSHSDHDHFGQTWTGNATYGLRLQNSAAISNDVLRAEATDTTASSYAVYGINNSTQGRGVVGLATATTGVAWGVYGVSASSIGHGVSGEATATTGFVAGVSGYINSDAGAAVQGFANSLTGQAYGVSGSTNAAQGIGVYGGATGSGTTYGTFGFSQSPTGYGLYGWNQSLTGTSYGTYGLAYSTGGIGVFGGSSATSGLAHGVFGVAESTAGRAVEGLAGASTGVNYGIFGSTNSTAGYAGFFVGHVHVQGTLSKLAGSFKIDHPLDPENKYLYHSFVESPDMKNVYDGVVTTDAMGYATVELPAWFEALNRDFRYQLTVIEEGDAFVLAKIARKIEGNRFVVRTSRPGIEVSWQVTGIRKDPYAEKNRIPVEEDKPEAERGKYLSPAAYGLPPERGEDYDPSRSAPHEIGPLPGPPQLRQ